MFLYLILLMLLSSPAAWSMASGGQSSPLVWTLLVILLLVVGVSVYLLRTLRGQLRQLQQVQSEPKSPSKPQDPPGIQASHELKTSINSLLALGEALLHEPVPGNTRARLALLLAGTKRLGERVDGFGSEDNVNMEPLDLAHQVDTVMALIDGARTERAVQLVGAVPVGLPAVLADAGRLLDILYNLLDNALKATESGQITVSAMAIDGKVLVSIADTGCGIEKVNIDRICNPQSQGTGLSIVNRLLHLLDSQIKVESTPGQGSTFSFELNTTTETPRIPQELLLPTVKTLEPVADQHQNAALSDNHQTAQSRQGNDDTAHQQLLDANRQLEQQVAEHTEALQQRSGQLDKANAARLDFLAKMGHEIRTPMNSVIGLSRLALKSGLKPRQQDYVEKIYDAGRSLLGLINDILDFSTLEAGKLTIEHVRFAVEDTVRDALGLCLMNAHHKGLELICDLDPQLPKMLGGDPQRLRQVIVNLINNGVKFTESGGICLRVRVVEGPDKVLFMQCSVLDTGPGMTPEQQEHLFDSFGQDEGDDNPGSGTGLGLAISKRLCELMGGKVWVESAPGFGTTVHFSVKVTQVGETLLAGPQPPFLGMRVLVVEDLQLAAQALSNQLTALGMECVTVADPESAVETALAAMAQDNPFVLALVDWSLPNLDGGATINRLLGAVNPPPNCLVLANAYQMEDAKAKAPYLSEGRMVAKPFYLGELEKAVRGALGSDNAPALPTLDKAIPDWSGFHVLLVEDNAINRQVAMGFLADTSVSVVTANNGLEALEKLGEGQFDLVLMDIEMPKMDGLTASRTIRDKLGLSSERLPIIALTARVMMEDVEQFISAGINHYLSKPFEPPKLYQTLAPYFTEPSQQRLDGQGLDVVEQGGGSSDDVLAQLNRIEAINPERALDKLHGRLALYVNLIKDFIAEQQQTAERMKSLFAEKDWSELYRQVHSLKSNAAYIGAYNLAMLSESMENALNADNHDAFVLDELCRSVNGVVNSLSRVRFDSDMIADLQTAGEMAALDLQNAQKLDLPCLLVIDDTPQMLNLLTVVFGEEYRVHTASDGESGLDKADDLLPDLVISDLVMPGINGYEVCERLKSADATSHVPVILLTTKADIDSRRQGWQAHADAYVTKPFDEQELKLQVQALLDNRNTLKARFGKQWHEQPDKIPEEMVKELSPKDRDFLQRFEALIAKRYDDVELNLTSCASDLAVSGRLLQMKLKALMDHGFTDYLRTYRLNKAMALLKGGEAVADVADKTGFSSQSYFSRCFKTEFGKTPSSCIPD